MSEEFNSQTSSSIIDEIDSGKDPYSLANLISEFYAAHAGLNSVGMNPLLMLSNAAFKPFQGTYRQILRMYLLSWKQKLSSQSTIHGRQMVKWNGQREYHDVAAWNFDHYKGIVIGVLRGDFTICFLDPYGGMKCQWGGCKLLKTVKSICRFLSKLFRDTDYWNAYESIVSLTRFRGYKYNNGRKTDVWVNRKDLQYGDACVVSYNNVVIAYSFYDEDFSMVYMYFELFANYEVVNKTVIKRDHPLFDPNVLCAIFDR